MFCYETVHSVAIRKLSVCYVQVGKLLATQLFFCKSPNDHASFSHVSCQRTAIKIKVEEILTGSDNHELKKMQCNEFRQTTYLNPLKEISPAIGQPFVS